MNSRRSFFRTFALSVAAISSAQILIPTARDAYKWKRTGQWLVVPNPEYVDAPLEMGILDFDGSRWMRRTHLDSDSNHSKLFPYRYDITGTRLIPPFIKKFVSEPHYSL